MDEMDSRGERESVRRISKERWYHPSQKANSASYAGAEIPKTDTRNSVAYVPKPTQTPVSAKDSNDDSGDTHMDEETVEEKKDP